MRLTEDLMNEDAIKLSREQPPTSRRWEMRLTNKIRAQLLLDIKLVEKWSVSAVRTALIAVSPFLPGTHSLHCDISRTIKTPNRPSVDNSSSVYGCPHLSASPSEDGWLVFQKFDGVLIHQILV
ncbi:hypothetical protein CDAR_68641 [Caerostris darwini]|uniref:Uncharacterized protein n=1 Tax=Caerostris darwini TaxID=1538125 RepID=A0AAV4QSN5_9ARAC|nr:hypothetical protein CDAR_68641 [Caerostris darwini]